MSTIPSEILFSVLIPTYNRINLLCDTIDSVLAQSYSSFEVIVVDDGSTDGTLERLKSYGTKIAVLTQSKCGPEEARRKAARIAKGRYFVLLDSDDLLLPWALDVYRRIIEKFGSPALVVGLLEYFSAGGHPLQTSLYPHEIAVYWSNTYLSKEVSTALSSSNIVVRRSVFEHSGAAEMTFDTFPLDTFHYILLFGVSQSCVIIKSPHTVAYRLHSSNVILDVAGMLRGLRRLVDAERAGLYPHGRLVWIDRYACIGGITACWLKKAFRRRLFVPAFSVFLKAAPMLFVALWRVALRQLRAHPKTVLIPF